MAGDLGKVLLVGGTGMLAGLAAYLAPRSAPLVLAARRPLELSARLGADPVAFDWNDRASVETLLTQEYDLVISWLHRDGLWLTSLLEKTLRPAGRSIRVHNSRSVDPQVRRKLDPPPRPDITRQIAVLAWEQRRGSRRWLTHDQICNGVIELVRNPHEPLLMIGDHLDD